MTTFRTLDDPEPDHGEILRAALAMADFDGKFGDYEDALEWLGVAEIYAKLPEEYEVKRKAWQRRVQPDLLLVNALARRTVLPPIPAEQALSKLKLVVDSATSAVVGI